MALARMPAAVELLSILKSNPPVRELFGDILGGAPRLADIVAMRPHVLDAAIDPALLKASGDEAYYDRRCAHILQSAGRTEEFLDAVRDMAQEEAFLIGLRILSALIAPEAAGRAYSHLAASLVRATLAHVQNALPPIMAVCRAALRHRRHGPPRLAGDDGGLRSRSHPAL